ncbi:hypothetical protein [Methylobacterium marchantiae]|uniref:Uncharacterized protein n=1 Tax=Methylobacterium marchantiae TaxID=600331 RepID=A0ABW3X1Z9_9HYPH|nr:hypothetical protein AIGOOFII_3467 [Methylobacterium marchantiae]
MAVMRALAGIPVARSYAREDEDGNLIRVVVYREPASGRCVQVTTPVQPMTPKRK